jgi:hypothetical protein
MASAAFSVSIPPQDVRNLVDLMQRARTELHKTMRQSVGMAGYYITRSLSASTKVAPKLRKVVRNPDDRWKTDRRRAPYGVMRFAKDGSQYFKPIFKTGEYGKIRFYDKKSMSWFEHFKGDSHWERLPSGPDDAGNIAPGIMTDKRRKIGRRGLAKKSWQFMSRTMRGGVSASRPLGVYDVPVTARVRWYGGNEDPTLLIENYLRYINKAFKSDGPQNLTDAAQRACNAMRVAIEKNLARVR